MVSCLHHPMSKWPSIAHHFPSSYCRDTQRFDIPLISFKAHESIINSIDSYNQPKEPQELVTGSRDGKCVLMDTAVVDWYSHVDPTRNGESVGCSTARKGCFDNQIKGINWYMGCSIRYEGALWFFIRRVPLTMRCRPVKGRKGNCSRIWKWRHQAIPCQWIAISMGAAC